MREKGHVKRGREPANEKIKQERNNQWWRDKSRLCKRGGYSTSRDLIHKDRRSEVKEENMKQTKKKKIGK